MRLFYSPAYVLAGYAFDTTRKSGWIAESLAQDPIPGVEIAAPTALTAAEVEAIHAPAYVAAVRTGQPRALAESQGFQWDGGLWPMVLASNGGAVAAARAAL
jgi:acetoin utilization deacetylase AcuC-like enzyme